MNREEFLNRLGASLNGEVPTSVIQENLNYYDGYIREEAAKGRSEEEIIDEIGGYRLIAKTIIEASGGEEPGGSQSGYYDSQGYGRSYTDTGYDGGQSSYGSYGSYGDDRERRPGGSFHMYDLSRGWKRFIIPAVIILVLLLIVSIIGGLLTLLSPLIGPLIVVVFLYTLFKNRR